jgi:hypothetical protein
MSRNTTRRSTTRTRAAAAKRKTRTIRTASGNPYFEASPSPSVTTNFEATRIGEEGT